MSSEPRRAHKRGTPISDSLGADLQALGSILANHTRGLDNYLNHQASRIEKRHQSLLAEVPELLRPADFNLDAMSVGQLQDLCRQWRLRGWSKLRRADLLAFIKQHLGPELAATAHPDDIVARDTGPLDGSPHATIAGPDASRCERLILLLLHHLGVPKQQVDIAWRGDKDQKIGDRSSQGCEY
ncbi:MAG: hypothetical protein ACKN89_12210 [Cyanobium sp.]|jgi:hypothetical protein